MTDAYTSDPILSEAAEKWSQFCGTSLMPRNTSELWHALSDQVRSQSMMGAILDESGNVLTYRSGAKADLLFAQKLSGLRIDEYLKPEIIPHVKQFYQDLVRDKRPLYVTSEHTTSGNTVTLRRLILPLASEGDNVVDGALVVFSWLESACSPIMTQDTIADDPAKISVPVAISLKIERRGMDQTNMERDPDCSPQSDISRQALAAWYAAKKDQNQPVPRDDLIPFRLKEALPHIALIEHEAQSGRFRFRLCGSISVAIANRDVTGRYLDEIYTGELAAQYTPILHEVLRNGKPARLHGTLTPPGKPIRHIEYVCLPVSAAHAVYDQIIVVNAYIDENGKIA